MKNSLKLVAVIFVSLFLVAASAATVTSNTVQLSYKQLKAISPEAAQAAERNAQMQGKTLDDSSILSGNVAQNSEESTGAPKYASLSTQHAASSACGMFSSLACAMQGKIAVDFFGVCICV